MAFINIEDRVRSINIDNINHILGKGLTIPDNPSNSGSRKLMKGSQDDQRMNLLHAEVPFYGTGYEKQFGINSSSFTKINENLVVIGSVAKFDWIPKHHYYLFTLNEDTKTIHVFERKEYKHITESYGYMFNNDIIDTYAISGSIIPEGTTIQKSMSFDEFDNRMDGLNLLTMYSACEDSMEDAIIISESASKKLSSALIKKVKIEINDNHIPLNLYGDNDIYKIIPDINEHIKNSILCATREERKEECLFSQSYARLREISTSDIKYTVSGRVVDVDIYCNSPDRLSQYEYNGQLKKYYNNYIRCSRQIVECIDPYLNHGYTMDYDLQKLYSISRDTINGKRYYDERAFSNIVINITVIEDIPAKRGDKLCNRYGGKGIISRILPDEEMPMNLSGDHIEIILNMCGVYGRENAGQLFEVTVTYICMKIIEYINLNVLDISECVNMYIALLSIVAPEMVDFTMELLENMTDEEVIMYINSMCGESEKCLYIAAEPITENMTIDKVNQLYKAFSWIKPEPMLMPVKGSNGQLRYAPSRRPLIYGYQYIYRLKQYAEEKFSVTSLSATNIRNENSKSKSSNNYKALYSRTPIRFGDMETGNLIHLGAELVIQMLMLYSTSPNARRLASQMITDDAFNIDVKLDRNSKNRNVEILNVYLKTMGLQLVFIRRPKQYIAPISYNPIVYFSEPGKLLDDPISIIHPDEKFDIKAETEKMLKSNRNGKTKFEFIPMVFFDRETSEGER